jgi:hypothetical protein
MNDKSITELAADTLAGDLRDTMLTHIRSMEDPWSKLSERQQEDKIYAISRATETVVRRAVAILAAADMPHISVSVSKFTVKDGIKGEIIAQASVSNIEKLAEYQGDPALLVFASPEAYLGARGEAKADPDEPELGIEDTGGDDDDDGDGEAADIADPDAPATPELEDA